MSMFISRFEALTGGEDGGAARLGDSNALTMGTGTLPRGILGVRTGGTTATTSATGVGARGGRILAIGGRVTFVLTARGGVLGSVTSEKPVGKASGSESRRITLAPGGTNFAGLCTALAIEVLGHNGTSVLAKGLSCWTGLEALQVAGECSVFCLFGALSSTNSFSFSLRASYGDCIGWALPMGPLGVPSKVFSDL